MAAAEDMLFLMTTMMPLMMPFAQGILFGMHLLNLQETQVVCHQAHPCFEGHAMVAIVMETMMVAVAPAIKEVGRLSSCFAYPFNLGHHLSFQSKKNWWLRCH
jgi:hypothetical protein